MKIVKKCGETSKESVTKYSLMGQIPKGTIFRFNDLCAGPYLRTGTGALNLNLSEHFDISVYNQIIYRYVELPNAYLVTGED